MNLVQKVGAGIVFYAWHLKGWKRRDREWVLKGWNFEADRSQLYGVLGSIGKVAKEEEECKLADELENHRPGGETGPSN